MDATAVEDDPVAAWRRERFDALGLTQDAAEWASHSAVDWHEVEALVAAGCPVLTALRICF